MFHGVACPGFGGWGVGEWDWQGDAEGGDQPTDSPTPHPPNPGECVSGRTSAPGLSRPPSPDPRRVRPRQDIRPGTRPHSMMTRSLLLRPKVSGAYISSALAGGTTKVPGVVARAV